MKTIFYRNFFCSFTFIINLIHSVLPESKNIQELNSEDEENIIGGKLVVLGQFPFIVSVEAQLETKSVRFCGGSILKERIVVSAAHCFNVKRSKKLKYFYVVAGQVNLSSNEKEYAEHRQKNIITKIINHTNYDAPKFLNDICLLKTQHSFKFNNYVRPIALTKSEPSALTECQTAGWGANGTKKANNGSCMYINLHIQEHKACKIFAIYKKEVMLCAQAPVGIDGCRGDSGGPLICNSSLAGLVSFGKACGRGKPAAYTNVYSALAWINEIIKEEEDEIATVKPTLRSAETTGATNLVVDIRSIQKNYQFLLLFPIYIFLRTDI